jgi:hypothetical protein
MVYFQTQIPIWVNFGGSCNGRCWYIYGDLLYFTASWYNKWLFGFFVGDLVYFPRLGILYQGISGNPGLDQNSSYIQYNQLTDVDISVDKVGGGVAITWHINHTPT